VANVWDALKKYQAEQAREGPGDTDDAVAAPAADAEAPDADAGTPVAAAERRAAGEGEGARTKAPRRARQPYVVAKGHRNGYAEALVAHHDRGGAITEEYRALRTNLTAQHPDQRFCIMLTSALPTEGKTITALNLAMVLAEHQECRTIIVDGDIRRGRIHRCVKVDRDPGLVEVLRRQAPLADAVRPTTYPNVFVLPSGRADATEVGEVLARTEFEQVVAELRRRYDYVLFDTPPINVAADAGMMGRAVNEALLVVRMNKTRRESVDKAVRLLHAANVKPVGIVLTHQRYYIPGYLYRYS
jgi:capsular exopolysaccharide synthesis family protein